MSKVKYGHYGSENLARAAADRVEARSNCDATVRKMRGRGPTPWVVEIPRTCSIGKKIRGR